MPTVGVAKLEEEQAFARAVPEGHASIMGHYRACRSGATSRRRHIKKIFRRLVSPAAGRAGVRSTERGGATGLEEERRHHGGC